MLIDMKKGNKGENRASRALHVQTAVKAPGRRSGREKRTRPPKPQIDGGRDCRGRVHQGRIQNNRQEKHRDHRVLSCDFTPPLENTCLERKPGSRSILRFFCLNLCNQWRSLNNSTHAINCNTRTSSQRGPKRSISYHYSIHRTPP
jgi:hypothetical protein